jgi:hypothetical protein
MFRATMCPSSGETTVFMRYLVLVILCGWLSGMQNGTKRSTLHTSHPYRITSTKCRINTVVSPDDGNIVARNMLRLINIIINKYNTNKFAPSWLYLQDYTGTHGHQNIKFYNIKSILHTEVARSCHIQNTFQKSKTHSNAQYNTKHYFNYITYKTN